ncbi:MAG: 2-oxoglutarate dehydrogenase E1 component [Gammaproteobacteria bacterium]|nr:MAG: 2-oxoglutarate dehydrogenase E1 component [Gammaproteobacteria bacterium]
MEQRVPPEDLYARWRRSQLSGQNAAWLEALYEDYLADPARVPAQWRRLFEQLPPVSGTEVPRSQVEAGFRNPPTRPLAAGHPGPVVQDRAHERKQIGVLQLINAWRFRGHQVADVDPLGLREIEPIPELDPAHHGLTEADLDTEFDTGSLAGADRLPLREIVARLRAIYGGPIGWEYMHLLATAEKRWLQARIERPGAWRERDPEARIHILRKLTAAEGLERYLHSRYTGQKRFSLEGGDSLIPLLDALLRHASASGVREVALGMAHRGRLNVLVNVLGKTPDELFAEFEGRVGQDGNGTGDVKYHMGFSSNLDFGHEPLHLALAFNPSHLEIVDPVVEGSTRCRQDRRGDSEGKEVMPVLVHGDAAFAGQGVVMETLNMSQTRGFSTKGTVHIVVDNQIGFTTSNQRDARSTTYCTDVAKMVNAPIFHVNGDDPEAVCFVARLAMDYRATFHKDVVIDLVCYRRHGHSEADEPMATQPVMYRVIRSLPTPREKYARRLVQEGVLDEAAVARLQSEYRERLESGRPVLDNLLPPEVYPYAVSWKPYLKQACTALLDTSVPLERLRALWQRLERLPEGFELHPGVRRILENRRKMTAGALPIDWGYAETMAYATLVTEGWPVRLSGQDSGRGTFFHRHAVLYNQRNGEAWVPLRHLADDQANFLVINSLLSEEAVLAFEYGYATTDPRTLVIWEAQFGDFANNAQVVIDQFISAGEQKWNRLCGLVLFLPHGYEGQGPEHSSARLERFLQLCAQHNMQVCVPTTPAQIFHLLRRQALLECRKPLVVFTPKSLLRHRLAVSRLEDLTEGAFLPLIDEIDPIDPERVRRVVLCSGKVYYDLLEKRREAGLEDVAILRIERLYPFPEGPLRKMLARYARARQFVWCQEEPMNQGAWFQIHHHLLAVLPRGKAPVYAGRPFSAAPAVGYTWLHLEQQRALVEEALGLQAEGRRKRTS